MPPDKQSRPADNGAAEMSNVVGGGQPDDTRSTLRTTCTFCGAPALEPNRADRRRGLTSFMAHANWCPTAGLGRIRHSTKWARS